MRVLTTGAEVRHQVAAAHGRAERVGLVPTRGDLHDGHAAIIRTAHAQCDVVVVTIVRPDGSPAFHERHDEDIARDAGADLLWRPMPGPLVSATRLRVVPNDAPHLAALATAATQQLGIIRPDVVYAGDEHYDHARILRDIVREFMLNVDVRIVAAPRDADGLPLGSGTRTLSPASRASASAVPRALDAVVQSAAAGERSLFRLRARAEAHLADAGADLQVNDVATVDPTTHVAIDVFDRDVLLVVRAEVDGVPIVDSRLLTPFGHETIAR